MYFHCWILASFSSLDKSFAELDKEECGENDICERDGEGVSWEESNQKKVLLFIYFLNQAQNRKLLKECDQHKREKMNGNQIKPI